MSSARDSKQYSNYQELILRLEPDGRGGFCAHAQLPENGGSASFEPPFRPSELVEFNRGIRRSASAAEQGTYSRPLLPARELGEQLFRSLFHGQIKRSFDRLLGSLEQGGRDRLRLRLLFDPSQPGIAEHASLPWELLYDSNSGGFLGQRLDFSVVRRLGTPVRCSQSTRTGRLRVLVAKAQTSHHLDLKSEELKIRQAWEQHGRVSVDVFRATDRDSLRDKLRSRNYHVVHFMGHGDYDPSTGRGHLLLEGKGSEPESLTAKVLANDLSDLPTRLVVLNTCLSGYHSCRQDHDPYNGIATALVQHGVPAVVAMQFRITDAAAIAFSGAFYRALARSEPIDAAMVEGRKAIYSRDETSVEWAIPALFLSVDDGHLFDLKSNPYRTASLPPPPVLPAKVSRSPRHGLALGAMAASLLALIGAGISQWDRAERQHFASPSAVSMQLESTLFSAADNPPQCPSPPDLDMAFVFIPPGSASIGSTSPEDHHPLEPTHFQLRKGLCVGKTEVTETQWNRLGEPHTGDFHEGDYPITGISREEVSGFLRRANHNDLHEQRVRLPTDEEWEYILRANTATPYFFGSDPALLPKYGNCKAPGYENEDGFDRPAPVGEFQPNPFGIYGLVGNVFEWVTSDAPDVEPGQAVRRGGSYQSTKMCRSASRSIVSASWKHHDSGFRLVRDPVAVP